MDSVEVSGKCPKCAHLNVWEDEVIDGDNVDLDCSNCDSPLMATYLVLNGQVLVNMALGETDE